MPNFTIDFEVVCGKCGAGLCNQSSGSNYRGQNVVTVDPCEKCINASYDEGFEHGNKED